MIRLTAAVLLAGCFCFQVWAQTSPAQPAAQTPAEKTSAAPAVAPAAQTGFPLDQFQEFSAIMVGGPVPGTEDGIHIYRSGNLMRMEANEGRSYQITDLAKKETHGISKTGCLKYKNVYVRSYPFMFSNPANKFERTPVGKETVDGHVCQVEDVTVTLPKANAPAKFRLWEAEDLHGFPVKVETKMHRTIQYKSIVLGPQDPTLFIFSEECQNGEEIGGGRPPVPSAKPTPAPGGKPQ